jgi:hypothetical protein
MSNANGQCYNASLETNMDAYDRLPRALRQVLQDSDHNWSAKQLRLESCRPKAKRKPQVATTAAAVAFIRQQDNARHMADAAAGLVCLQRGEA